MSGRQGIDVSNNNHGMLPSPSEYDFAFAKATEGAGFDDRNFEGYVLEFDREAKPWGPYHFVHADVNTPEAEADWFLKHAQRGPLGWALDVESRDQGRISPLAIMGASRLAAWCDTFRALVEPELGPSWFYCNKSYATALFPHLGTAWRIWLATLNGAPRNADWAGRTVDVEQFAINGGFDRNLERTDLQAGPPAQGDDDMNQLEAVAAAEIALRVMFSAPENATPQEFTKGFYDAIATTVRGVLAEHGIPAGGPGTDEATIRRVVQEELAKVKLKGELDLSAS